MKALLTTLSFSALASLLLTQCSAPRAGIQADTVRVPAPTPTGNVSVKAYGDTTVATRRLIPVSYTHLDVYKRQKELRAKMIAWREATKAPMPTKNDAQSTSAPKKKGKGGGKKKKAE